MKKQSAANFRSKPPDPPVFFLDRTLGRRIVAEALRRAGHRVEIHDDHFDQSAPDEEWLSNVGSRGWVVITQDRRIRYRQTEIQALVQGGVRAFVLAAGHMRGEEAAESIVQAMPEILRTIRDFEPPFVFGVSRQGVTRRLR